MSYDAEFILLGLQVLACTLAFFAGIMSAYISIQMPEAWFRNLAPGVRPADVVFQRYRFDLAHLLGFGTLFAAATFALQLRASVASLAQIPHSPGSVLLLALLVGTGSAAGRWIRFSRLGAGQ